MVKEKKIVSKNPIETPVRPRGRPSKTSSIAQTGDSRITSKDPKTEEKGIPKIHKADGKSQSLVSNISTIEKQPPGSILHESLVSIPGSNFMPHAVADSTTTPTRGKPKGKELVPQKTTQPQWIDELQNEILNNAVRQYRYTSTSLVSIFVAYFYRIFIMF
jgi:hypothetical protein